MTPASTSRAIPRGHPHPARPSVDPCVRQVAARLLAHRRAHASDVEATTEAWARQQAQLEGVIAAFVRTGAPVHLVIAGFSFKSPSPRRTIGPRPDAADAVALADLQALAAAIAEHYAPGARITIYSDGHGFNRILGVADGAVSAYAAGIRAMIAHLPDHNGVPAEAVLRYVTLDRRVAADAGATVDALVARYRATVGLATPADDTPEAFTAYLAAHPDVATHYGHLAAFLAGELQECARTPDFTPTAADLAALANTPGTEQPPHTWSRRLVRTVASARAKQLMRAILGVRHLIREDQATDPAVRLSIHPTVFGDEKLGITLGPDRTATLSPWHGCLLVLPGAAPMAQRRIVRRWVAEALGATCVRADHPLPGVLQYIAPSGIAEIPMTLSRGGR